MTYRTRGRSIFEVILAVCFTGFLVGFITVLCIGNYFRAKRAQERQRQRRLAKLASASGGGSGGQIKRGSSRGGGGGSLGSPQSAYASTVAGDSVGAYEAPMDPGAAGVPSSSGGVRT